MRTWAILISVLALAACSTVAPPAFTHVPESGEIVPLSRREAAVLRALLEDKYGSEIAAGTPLVIAEKTSLGPFSGKLDNLEKDLLTEYREEVPVDAIRAFIRSNVTEKRLGSELGSQFRVVLFSAADTDDTWGGRGNGWKRFYRLFPKSPGVITISRVGFSRDGRTAVVYLGGQRDWLWGGGGYYYLRLTGGRWKVLGSFGPVWIS